MSWTGTGAVREGRTKPISDLPPPTREEAMKQFVALVRAYGLRWTAQTVPQKAAWDALARCNAVLTEADRREALGLAVKPHP